MSRLSSSNPEFLVANYGRSPVIAKRVPLVGSPCGALITIYHSLLNCPHMAQKEFSPAERQDIVKYLNEQFYRFQ